MTIPPDTLRETMRQWASGVSVVTTTHDGALYGMTVSSFTSVSLDPPQILICLENATRTCATIVDTGLFGVSILGEQHQEWSNRFAGQLDEMDERFVGIPTETRVTGAPLLDGALAHLDCTVTEAHVSGTHTIIVGQVEYASAADDPAKPLLYYHQNYRGLADI